MRVLVIDPDKARAALVAEGLADVKPLEVRSAPSFEAIEAELEAFAPDVIVIACDSPDRDTLENLRQQTLHNQRPVVMFVDRSAPGLADAAVEAGVAAYVVDGLSAKRVRPVLEVALTRFQLMQRLRGDLAKAQADLAARKTIDRAKGLLMKERGLDEEAAYQAAKLAVAAAAADVLLKPEHLAAVLGQTGQIVHHARGLAMEVRDDILHLVRQHGQEAATLRQRLLRIRQAEIPGFHQAEPGLNVLDPLPGDVADLERGQGPRHLLLHLAGHSGDARRGQAGLLVKCGDGRRVGRQTVWHRR